ncbi:MAG TPA: hypothetical protein VGC07_05620 [Granulicella sp.]
MTVAEDKEILTQVDRILHSEELRSSEVLRRLFKFLAEKSASGEADDLKEYVVAIDGMGKPSSYDPRHDSAVRIQVGRLRQKLADFYRTEGQDDPIIIDIPKGRFKLCYEHRKDIRPPIEDHGSPTAPHLLSAPENLERHEDPPQPTTTRLYPVSVLLVILAVAAAYILFSFWKMRVASAAAAPNLTSDLQALWEPFLSSKRPLIAAIEDPLFVEFHTGSGVYVRDKSINDWKNALSSPAISAVHESMKGVDLAPSQYYTAFGEVHAAFLFGKFLGPRTENFSIVKTSDLSWQQLADNEILFVGVQNLFFESQLNQMPIELQLVPVAEGIKNMHPQNGEPSLFIDKFTTAPEEAGVTYALITRLPGPLGNNNIESFTSNRSAGYIAAVKAFTDPGLAQNIVTKLKQQSGGRVPRYFQVLLRVKFKNEVPTATDCLFTRELR